jgi:hypothetical protein
MNTEVTPSSKRSQFMDMLQPGDWINFQIGWHRRNFYVLARSDERILVGNPKWLVSAAIWVRASDIYSECDTEGVFNIHPLHEKLFQGSPIYLGRGKKRWWRILCIGMKDVIAPWTMPKSITG